MVRDGANFIMYSARRVAMFFVGVWCRDGCSESRAGSGGLVLRTYQMPGTSAVVVVGLQYSFRRRSRKAVFSAHDYGIRW